MRAFVCGGEDKAVFIDFLYKLSVALFTFAQARRGQEQILGAHCRGRRPRRPTRRNTAIFFVSLMLNYSGVTLL